MQWDTVRERRSLKEACIYLFTRHTPSVGPVGNVQGWSSRSNLCNSELRLKAPAAPRVQRWSITEIRRRAASRALLLRARIQTATSRLALNTERGFSSTFWRQTVPEHSWRPGSVSAFADKTGGNRSFAPARLSLKELMDKWTNSLQQMNKWRREWMNRRMN